MNIPDDLFYTKDHEWVKIDGDNADIGITDYAQSALGDITFIDLPKAGSKIVRSKVAATVESVKAASDVYAPLSGLVIKANTGLADHPELVNKSAYGSGWFVRIKISDMSEKSKLMTAAQYKDFVQGLSK